MDLRLVKKVEKRIVASYSLQERLTLLMPPKVEGGKFDVTNGKLLRSWMGFVNLSFFYS